MPLDVGVELGREERATEAGSKPQKR